MPRNPSGTYTRPDNSFTQPVLGEVIDPVAADDFWDDLDAALTDSLSRTGEGGMQADLDMDDNAVTGASSVGVGTDTPTAQVSILNETGDGTFNLQGDGGARWWANAQSNANGNRLIVGTGTSELDNSVFTAAAEGVIRNKVFRDVADLSFFGTSADVAAAVQAAIDAGYTKVWLPGFWTYIPPNWPDNPTLYNKIPDGLTIIGADVLTSIVASSDEATKFLLAGPFVVLTNVGTRSRFSYAAVNPVNTLKLAPVVSYQNNSSANDIVQAYPFNTIVNVAQCTLGGVTFPDLNAYVGFNSTFGGTFFANQIGNATGYGFDVATNGGATGVNDGGVIIRNGYTNPANNHWGLYLNELGTHANGRGIFLERGNGSTVPLMWWADVGPTTYTTTIQKQIVNYWSGGTLNTIEQGTTASNGTINKINAGLTGGTFTGNFADWQINSVSKFKVDYTGAATLASVNKVAITAPATSATLTVADGKTLTASNTLTFTGTDGSTINFGAGGTFGTAAYQNTGTSGATLPFLNGANTWSGVQSFNSSDLVLKGSSSGTTTLNSGAAAGTSVLTLPIATDTLVGKATTDTLTNKTFDTAGTGNSFSINGVAATANTGTGAVARASSPTFVTPTLGAATATSINKVAFTAPATSATLTIADGKTATISSSLTLNGSDGKTLTISNTGTLTGGDGFVLSIAAGKTATVSNTLTFTGTDSSSVAFGTGGTVLYNGGAAGTPLSITLTNGTGLPLTTGVIGTLPVANGGTGDTGTAWTTSTPTVVCSQSTGTAIGTASARTKTIGKTVFWDVTITISGTFTVGTITSVGLPVTAGAGNYVVSGREYATTGNPWNALILAGGTTCFPNGTGVGTTITSGNIIVLTGVFESA